MHAKGRIVGLIVAAGSGVRAGGGVPKQYHAVRGQALIAHAIDRLSAHPAVDAVQIVIGDGQRALYDAAIGDRVLPPPVIGGASRRESVARGLNAIGDADIVLVHDAARPFLPAAVIDRLLAALETADGAVPALPVADTLARGDGQLGEVVPRAGLFRVQTPQAFRLPAIRAAHAAWDEATEATDDAQMARAAGIAVAIVEGDGALDKITTEADLKAAQGMNGAKLISRSAQGFDVHRYADGCEMWLGGIRVDHPRGLSGHSDADVALHAITDALLGTICDGDIGSHFPPSDPRWKGADSARFIAHARDLVAARGGIIDHVDLTIICEAPKIGPVREAIRARVAELLLVPPGRISIKATTTEKLGFTGRGEGIAAQALATVRLPQEG